MIFETNFFIFVVIIIIIAIMETGMEKGMKPIRVLYISYD